MKRFSVFHVPLLSFFSRALYRDVALHWKGTVFAYLLLLLAICWIPSMTEFHSGLADFVDDEAPSVVEQVPRITIVDGEASIDAPEPYYIKDPESDEILVIIDTTGAINSLDDREAMVLMTRTKVIFQESKRQSRTFRFAEVDEFTLDQAKIMRWLNTAKKFLVLAVYPLVVLGSFLFRIIQVLIYAAIGMLFALWCKEKLSYVAMLRLAIIAVTPCIVVETVLGAAKLHPPIGVWYFLVTLGYLGFGVKASLWASQPPESQGNISSEDRMQG